MDSNRYLNIEGADIVKETYSRINSALKGIESDLDNLLKSNDAMIFKGVLDCSTNPNYPSGDAGHLWKVSVSGKLGGASGVDVSVGDLVICLVDDTVSGSHSSVGNNFAIVSVNFDVATEEEAIAGESMVKYMTPLRTKQAIDSYFSDFKVKFS